jgi:hypothetical protein
MGMFSEMYREAAKMKRTFPWKNVFSRGGAEYLRKWEALRINQRIWKKKEYRKTRTRYA